MFILNKTITVNFVIPVTASPLAQSAYDIAIIKPDNKTTYADSLLLTYTAPTATVQGKATFDVTVDQKGTWKFILSTGLATTYTVIATAQIFVISPITTSTSTTVNRNIAVSIPLLLTWPPTAEVSDIVGAEWDAISGAVSPALVANLRFGHKSLHIDSTGKRIYIGTNNKIYQYALSTAYDLTTISYINFIEMSAAVHAYISPNGTKAIIYDRLTKIVQSYTLSTAFDITSLTIVAGDSYNHTANFPTTGNLERFTVSHDGLRLFFGDRDENPSGGLHTLYELVLSTAWDVSTASVGATFDSPDYLTAPAISIPPHSPGVGELYGLAFSEEGNTLFLSYFYGGAPEIVYAYKLTTPYNISSAVHVTGTYYYILNGTTIDKQEGLFVHAATGNLITFKNGTTTTLELSHHK